MPKVKWDINGTGVAPAGMGYAGPDLPKGSYTAKVKRMTLDKIKSQGENHGKPRISVLLEICGPESQSKYFGAPVWDGLNIIDSSIPFVNAFLHGLTTGSEQAKHEVESAFWPPNGPIAKRESSSAGKEAVHIKKIGKYNINSPVGETLVQIVTKAGSDLQGNYRPEVSQYLPYTGPREAAVESDEDEEDDLLEDEPDDDELLDDEDDDLDASPAANNRAPF